MNSPTFPLSLIENQPCGNKEIGSLFNHQLCIHALFLLLFLFSRRTYANYCIHISVNLRRDVSPFTPLSLTSRAILGTGLTASIRSTSLWTRSRRTSSSSSRSSNIRGHRARRGRRRHLRSEMAAAGGHRLRLRRHHRGKPGMPLSLSRFCTCG